MKTIAKLSPAREYSWVRVVEYPDGTLCLEGVRFDPKDKDYYVNGLRFSLEAVKVLIPLMAEWVAVKEG